MAKDINVLALVKGGERYVFLFDDDHKSECLRTFGKFASNADLTFTWYDAAVLSQKVRQSFSPAATQIDPIAQRFQLPQQQDNSAQTPDELD